ncbi:hypothetical protein GCM10010420_36350 [Streptomyces glaucosporus]|uniref:Integral membrane protein n=1 Tax=Streptomyces glaucosporus TaxID=284044 RepID=A0ABN3II48_9ACTN
MIFLVPVVFLTALALVVFCLLRCFGIGLPGHRRWSGWRRAVVAAAYACAAVATASYSLGAMGLMTTVAVAQDGGADSAPFPYDHPCRKQLAPERAVDYEVRFLTLRTVCVMEDGTLREVADVPQRVRATAAASAASTAVLAGTATAATVLRRRLPAGGGR